MTYLVFIPAQGIPMTSVHVFVSPETKLANSSETIDAGVIKPSAVGSLVANRYRHARQMRNVTPCGRSSLHGTSA
jgi:hypothetical protein